MFHIQLQSNLLDVNGFTYSNFALIGLLSVIRLGWLIFVIDKSRGVDYEETYTPVTKITTVRILLVIITLQGWPLKQMDVKNVFLHGDLREGIYMTPPPSLFSSSTSEVCKLNRSLYGLKQTLRTWFEKFQLILLQFNFVQSQNDFFFFFCIKLLLELCFY